MIDYSKLQIEIIKNLCADKEITNKFCYTDDEIYLTDKSYTLFVAIPKEKFILDTSKFAFNEVKGLNGLIKEDVVQCSDNGLEKFIKPGLTVHIFTYGNKKFYIDSKKLKMLGYDASIYTVKTNPNKKYQPLQFYIDYKFVGMICPIKPNIFKKY